MFARQSVAEFVQHFGNRQRHAEPDPILRGEEIVKRRQLGAEDIELRGDEQQRDRDEQQPANARRRRKEPATAAVEPREQTVGVEAFEADAQDVAECLPACPPAPLLVAAKQLAPLPRDVGHHERTAVQRADKLVQFGERDFLRRESLFEAVLDLIETRGAVQRLQNRKLFVFEPVILQRHRVLQHPILPPLKTMPPRHQIRAHPQRQRPTGTGFENVGEWGHGMRISECGFRNLGNAKGKVQNENCKLRKEATTIAALSPICILHFAFCTLHDSLLAYSAIAIAASFPGCKSQWPFSRRFSTSARTRYLLPALISEVTNVTSPVNCTLRP